MKYKVQKTPAVSEQFLQIVDFGKGWDYTISNKIDNII